MTGTESTIISSFVKYKSYADVSREVGVSRQRVEQIVKKYRYLPLVQASWVKMKTPIDHSADFCKECGRSFKLVKFSAKGMCTTCYAYSIRKEARRSERTVLLRKDCINCGRILITKSKPGGSWRTARRGTHYCGECYAKTPEYKNSQKGYTLNPETRQRYLERQKRYYYKNREYLIATAKVRSLKWSREHKERIREIQRAYRLRKKASKASLEKTVSQTA